MTHRLNISLVGLLIASLALPTASAWAQNPVQIAHAKAGASCPRCNLFQADFTSVELKGKNFAGARLRQSDMSAAVMNHTSFAGADMRDVNAYGAVMSSANFAGANLTNASFVGTYLQGANFRGAHLEGVNFSGAEMSHAVGLSQAQLDSACGDASTTTPNGLRLHPCH